MTDPSELYQARILELSDAPLNEGPLEAPTHSAKKSNPLCGDRVKIELRLEGEKIEEVRFEGRGCAISRAAALMLTVDVVGLTPEQAAERGLAVEAWLKGQADIPPSESGLDALGGVRAFPSRIKCATLAWEALAKALSSRC